MLKGPYLIWGIGPLRWYISGLKLNKLQQCVFPCPLFCLSLELQTEQAVFACSSFIIYEPLLWLADCTLSGVVGSDTQLVPAGWGWEKSVIPWWHHTGEEVRNAYFLEWSEKVHGVNVFILVPTDPLQVITDSKSPENVFLHNKGPLIFKCMIHTYIENSVLKNYCLINCHWSEQRKQNFELVLWNNKKKIPFMKSSAVKQVVAQC